VSNRHTQIAAVLVSTFIGIRPAVPAVPSPGPGEAAEPARVAIIGTDYAFVQFPTAVDPGPTLLSFENRGSKRHEMSVALLRAGVTTEVLTRRDQRMALTSRAVSDSLIGLLVARPGERSGGQLYANLISGRSYVVICNLKDTPDAQAHVDLGMIATLHVR